MYVCVCINAYTPHTQRKERAEFDCFNPTERDRAEEAVHQFSTIKSFQMGFCRRTNVALIHWQAMRM